MTIYKLTRNDALIAEFQAPDHFRAMHEALDLAFANRPKGGGGSVVWKLLVGSGELLMRWSKMESADNSSV